MKQDKEQELLCRRLAELSKNAYYRGFCTYSDFLNLDEQNLFFNNYKEIVQSKYMLWGGYDDAERRVICFYEDDSSTNMFPLVCLKILPLNKKFSDKLTHRDYLGAILNLGIERCKIGDILVMEEKGYIFCRQEISDFICENLTRIKHTSIVVTVEEDDEIKEFKPTLEEIHGTVSSVRLDSILSVAFHTSRSSLTGLIAGGKVYVNSRLTESNSYTLKEGDVVSVRGMGKFIFKEVGDQTKKNRYKVTLLKYV